MTKAPYLRRLELGHAARLAGRFTEAVRHYEAAHRVAARHVAARHVAVQRPASTARDEADAIAGLGMAARGLCEYRRAITFFNRALVIYRNLRDDAGRAFCLYGRGGALRFLGDFRTAETDLMAALALAPDSESEIFTRMALGGLRRMTGRHEESLADYRRARTMAGRARLPYAMAYADCGIGNAWRLLGNRRRARTHLAKADARYRSIGDRVSRPYTLFALFLMDLEEGRVGRFVEMERLFRSTKDRRGLVYADLARAVRYLDRGESILATKAARAARTGARALGMKLETLHARLLLANRRADAVHDGYRRLGAVPPKNTHAIP